MWLVYVGIGSILAAILSLLALGYATFFRQPINHPQAFLKRGRLAGTKSLVACAGDSITHATVSADYVGMLRQRLGGKHYEFVNAGHNNDTSVHLLARLGVIISCQPDFITLLIGTNDVYRATQKLRFEDSAHNVTVPLVVFQKNLSALIEHIQSATHAQIAFLSIPMQGENLNSEANQVVTQYNAKIKEVCAAHNADYLPLYETLSLLISAKPVWQVTDKPLGIARTYLTPMLHYLLGRSWDERAKMNRFAILIDGIHLNKRGTAVVANLIEAWLLSNSQDGQILGSTR